MLAEVGGGSQRATTTALDNQGSAPLAFPGNVTAGNLLTCKGGQTNAGAVVVTDSQGNTWTVHQSGAGAFIAYAVAGASGACTVTVNPDGATADFSFSIDEFSGQHATPLDVDDGVTTGTSTAPSADITTVAADTLILGVVTHSGATTTITANDGTLIGEQETGGSVNDPHNAIFSIVASQGTYTIDWTLGASRTWSVYLVSIKAAAAAAGGLVPRKALLGVGL